MALTRAIVLASDTHVPVQAPKQQKAALMTLAAFAAAALLNTAAPAQADVKSTVCASNATAKICLKNSYQK